MRTDIIYSTLMEKDSGWDIEKAAALGREHARDMISSIVKNYSIMPVCPFSIYLPHPSLTLHFLHT